MNKYNSYKDSGIEWIGEVPSDWEIKRVGYISILLTGNPWKSELFDFDEGVKIVRGENVSEGFLRWGDRTRYWKEDVDKDSIFYLKDGDIVISMDGSKVGKNYVQIKGKELPLLLHQRMCRVRVNETYESKFILYFIGSEMFKYYIDVSKTDPMVPHITQKNIYDFKVSIPLVPEQTRIVQYLDTKTTLIDSLIQKTQEKINLLREKRTSLINHTVTKGLNPDVEMKDSGVEWIGEIPKHWSVTKLKYGVSLIIDKGIPGIGDIKISPENVESNTGKCFNLFSDYTGEGMKFVSGDVLLNKLRLYLKKIILTEYDGYSMGEMIVLRSNYNLHNRYLYYLLFHQGLIDLLDSQSTGVKLPRVSPDIILNSEIVYPPITEQIQIVEYLVDQFQFIDTLIHKEEKRVELLKEYRQTLISDVVTGKIKVTDYE